MSYYIVEVAGELPTYGALAKAKKLEDAEMKLLEYVRETECYIIPKDEFLRLYSDYAGEKVVSKELYKRLP